MTRTSHQLGQLPARHNTVHSTRSSKSSVLASRSIGNRKTSRETLETTPYSMGSSGSGGSWKPSSLMAWNDTRISPDSLEDDETPELQWARTRKCSWAVEASQAKRHRQTSLDIDRPKRHERDVYSGSSHAHIRTKSMPRIKPLLRRNTSDETSSLDLDRTTVENEGLGIYTNLERDKRHEDPASASHERRGYHHRSTSGTSQFSVNTNSSTNKPGSQYVHPMRQNPRPYTPPLSHSYQTSVLSSEHSGDGLRASESENPIRSPPTTSVPSSRTPPLRIQTTGSFTKLSTSSQLHIDGTPSSLHGAEPLSPVESTMSPLSRVSLDRGFRRKNSGIPDPFVRAANVQAAREAFEKKEAAKEQKHFQKESVKRDKQQQQLYSRRKSSVRPSMDTFVSGGTEKTHTTTGNYYEEDGTAMYEGSGPHRRGPKSTWILFLTWLRTRIFKLKRRVSNSKRE